MNLYSMDTGKSIFKSKTLSLMLCLIFLASLTAGCGKKDEALETFQSDIADFTSAIRELDTDINSINPSSDDAVSELLSYYDSMSEEFAKLASIEVPEDYSTIARLSEKANEYMTKAVSYYHAAFGNEPLDQDILNTASTYYAKSFEFIGYIGQVLMGAEITFQSDLEDSGANDTGADAPAGEGQDSSPDFEIQE